MLVSRDHLCAELLLCLSEQSWAASLGYLYIGEPYNTLPLVVQSIANWLDIFQISFHPPTSDFII